MSQDLDVLSDWDPPPVVPDHPRPKGRLSTLTEAAPVAAKRSAGWVEAMQAWRPPEDLATRKVKVTYLADPLIQLGKAGVLVAAGGTGKTTLLLYLLVAIATGRKFFGLAVKYGTGVLISADDSQEDLEGALALVVQAQEPPLTPAELKLVQEKARVHSLQGLDGLRAFATAAVGGSIAPTMLPDLVLEALAGIDDLVFVAFDTLRQFAGGATNDEVVTRIAIEGATTIAGETGASVLFSHHTGKQNYRDGVTDMYAGSGSAAIADNSRFVLLLQTTTWGDIASKVRRTGQEDGDPLVLTATRGSLLVKAPPPIFLCRNGYRITRVAGALMSGDQQEDQRDRAVLRAVREGSQSKNAIAAAVGGRKQATNTRVDVLEGRGYLMRTGSRPGNHSYMLSAEGARFLDYDE